MDRPSHCLSAVCNGASLRGLSMLLADPPGLRISPLLHLSPQRAHLPHVPPESNTMQYNTSHSPQKFPHKKYRPTSPKPVKRYFSLLTHPVTQSRKLTNLQTSPFQSANHIPQRLRRIKVLRNNIRRSNCNLISILQFTYNRQNCKGIQNSVIN